jgi:cytidine deaminase
MTLLTAGFEYHCYDNIHLLPVEDGALLQKAKDACHLAYAPYSLFKVGAVALLSNGHVISGANQENASFPAGLCAERVLLATASGSYPNCSITTIAISYVGENINSHHPITPCGICRQSLVEYEQRFRSPIKLILGGQTGKVYLLSSASLLLPLSFGSEDMK